MKNKNQKQKFGIDSLSLPSAMREYLKTINNSSIAYAAGRIYSELAQENATVVEEFVKRPANIDDIDTFLLREGYTNLSNGVEYLKSLIVPIRTNLRANTRCSENAIKALILDDIGYVDISSIQSPTLTTMSCTEAHTSLMKAVYVKVIELTGFEIKTPYNEPDIAEIVAVFDRLWASMEVDAINEIIRTAYTKAESPEQAEDPDYEVELEDFDFGMPEFEEEN